MNREEARYYLQSSGFSEEQISTIEQALEQEPCEDEYIKVPKKALKYRTAGMVAYNAEWLKNNFDIERTVICGAQEPCGDAISRQAAIKAITNTSGIRGDALNALYDLPPVNPTKIGHWIPVSEPPKELGTYLIQTDGEPYMCQCRWTDVNPYWTAFKTEPHWNIFDLPQYSKVVAWMPLPKPYEPQERSDKE